MTVVAEPLPSHRVESHALGERDAFDLSGQWTVDSGQGWRAFVRGVAAELLTAGHELRGSRLVIESDLPMGAGLSSSAAFAVGVALALLGRDDVDRVELARLCSRVENEWVGARTGLLDQLAVLLGREGHALRLDCRTLATEDVPLELGDWSLATLDSGEGHAHGESGYNARRDECERARRELGLESLREATAADAERLPAPLGARVRHVVSENERVDAAVAALRRGDLDTLGGLLDASHRSLRDDYEVSTPAVERAVEACRAAGAAGARIVGGGFGGSVLALFPPGADPPSGAVAVSPGPAARLL